MPCEIVGPGCFVWRQLQRSCQHAKQLSKAEHLVYVPPYDDVDVIAGQGTIGMEIVNQHSEPLDAIFVPVGGGGLLAGVAAYVKYLQPKTKIIGVEVGVELFGRGYKSRPSSQFAHREAGFIRRWRQRSANCGKETASKSPNAMWMTWWW